MVRKIVAALALMSLAGAVSASGFHREDALVKFHPKESSEREDVVKAPEIDPASAMAALTLLAGGLAVLRGRIVKN